MRHKVFGRKLGRTRDQRKLLFRNLTAELILHGRVKTTVAKAKAIKPLIDKLITQAKKGTLGTKREISGILPKAVAFAFFNTVVPHFRNRTSGFSRIVHLKDRSGDNAEIVVLEWVEPIELRVDKLEVTHSTSSGQGSEKQEKKKEMKVPEKAVGKKNRAARKRRIVNKHEGNKNI